jgi:hypothetical protein
MMLRRADRLMIAAGQGANNSQAHSVICATHECIAARQQFRESDCLESDPPEG